MPATTIRPIRQSKARTKTAMTEVVRIPWVVTMTMRAATSARDSMVLVVTLVMAPRELRLKNPMGR